MKFKGESIILESVRQQRGDAGSFSTIYTYRGTPSEISALRATLGFGAQSDLLEGGAFHQLQVTYGNTTATGDDAVTEKWEDDIEILEKDILYSELGQALSAAGKKEMRRWRANPETTLDLTIAPADSTVLTALQYEILRGVESVSVETFVLKRTRVIPANFATPRKMQSSRLVYPTAAFITAFAVPAEVVAIMPSTPAAPPVSTWGWLRRSSSRQFTGRGRLEETDEWIFAAWSQNLFNFA